MNLMSFGQTFGSIAEGLLPGITLSRHESGQSLPFHEHATAYVCVVLDGQFRETSRGRDSWPSTGNVLAHPAGESHRNVFGQAGAICLNLHLREAEFSSMARQADPELARAAQGLAAEIVRGASGDRLEMESLVAELLHCLEKPALRKSKCEGVERVLRTLNEAPEAPWTLTELAAVAGRHPTHLARQFRHRMGMTVGMYRRQRRLVKVCLDLQFGHDSLAQVAFENGYADQSHLSRELVAFTGLPPALYRRLSR